MIKPTATLVVALSLALGACNSGSGNNKAAAAPAKNEGAAMAAAANDSRAAPAAAASTTLALDSKGLQAVEAKSGKTDLLAFGSPADQAVEGLSAIFGARPTEDSVNQDCGAGDTRIVQWANGFRILAQDAKFVGWEAEQPGQSFANGIKVGSTRGEVDKAFQPEVATGSLGTGFTIMSGETPFGGDLSGAGPQARVTSLFAGTTCHFG